jgi:hypothetical protein
LGYIYGILAIPDFKQISRKEDQNGANPRFLIIPPPPKGEGGILFYVCPSVHPRYFSSHFSQILLMAEI